MIALMRRYVNSRLIASLFALLLFSCAGADEKAAPGAAIDWQGVSAAEVLERLQEEQKAIRSFSAGFVVTIDPPPKGYPANLQGLLFFARADGSVQLRVRGLAPFGRTVFDLVQTKDRIELYLPSKKTLYKGKPGEGVDDGPWAKIFASLFIDFTRFRASQTGDLKVVDRTVILPLDQGTLILKRDSGLPLEVYTAAGSIRFEDYQYREGLPSIPLRIKILREDGRSTTLCRLSQVELNQDLSAVFDLSAYQPEQIRELKDLEGQR